MQLTWLDWAVVAIYFLFNLGIGLFYAKRAGSSTREFFLSGRNVPGWLVVTGLVANYGIAGNWVRWTFVSGCVMIYCALFGAGKVILKEDAAGCALLALACAGAGVIDRNLNRRGWSAVVD